MKPIKIIFAILALAASSSALAIPAMSVITVNTEDPAAYVNWTKKHGKTVGSSINAGVGGICVNTAGHYSPGELYYWHLFDSHATAVAADRGNSTITKALKSLSVKRVISQADILQIVAAEPSSMSVGDTFSNWNIIVSTDDPALYLSQVQTLANTAQQNGFDDVSMAAYAYMTGPNAGKLMVVSQAPTPARLGEFLDATASEWAAPIMNRLGGIRSYEHGFMMNCTVVHSSQ